MSDVGIRWSLSPDVAKNQGAIQLRGYHAAAPFYVCADRYVISADIFLRMRGKFTIICAFQMRVLNDFYR